MLSKCSRAPSSTLCVKLPVAVAKRATDLAPALVLAAQILFGALFGIMGLFLADPIVAMIKVYLEERSKAMNDGPESMGIVVTK